jgi:hypothetical protein
MLAIMCHSGSACGPQVNLQLRDATGHNIAAHKLVGSAKIAILLPSFEE